jgi:signal transduction histidine kinase
VPRLSRPQQPLRILLVDDDPAHVELIRRSFESRGQFPDITVARSVAAAMERLSQGSPDLLITEWRLPDGEGLELLRRPERRTFPVMVMTGYGDQRTGVRAMRAGALDYAIKSAAAFEAMPHIVQRALREWSLMEERARLEEELRAAQRMEAISGLAGGIAHDFNNLLTIIGTHLELIQMAVPDNPEVEESAAEILKAYESAAALTRQMLAFGGNQVIEPALQDLNDAVRNVSAMLVRVIGEEYELELILTERPCPVELEPASFEQMVINLVVNARDAMAGGGKITLSTASASIDEPLTCVGGPLHPGEYVRLTVRDNGHGMSPEIQQRMFDPFFTTKPRGRGTGLGLPSALGIIRQSGGDVRVESVVDRGTTFTVFLPLAGRPVEATRSIDSTYQVPVDGTETILVAEDDASIRRLVERMLTSQGYTVLTAVDGAEAIEILEERGDDIDLLVTDVVMPKVSGPEVVEWLGGVRPDLRALFMSGYVDDRLQTQRLDPRKARYLAKPFTSRALCEMVRELLDAETVAAG